mmetsp:Transcript_37273/g.148794  ORF Transcript_37273/g.148794 Transcript_37273/m.148794 type:complete len:143 (-) Transcript_37273:839-1267(-)
MASIASGVAVSAGKFVFLAHIERVLVRMTRINFGRVWFFFSSGLSIFIGFVWKGTFVLAGASVSLTRPHEEVRVVTEMASLQERIKVLFGKFKSASNESSPETPAAMPTKQYVQVEEPKASSESKGSRSNVSYFSASKFFWS